MRRLTVFVVLLAVAALGLWLAPDALAASGNDVGHNIGSTLRHYAGEIYGGVIAIVGLVFLLNRKFTDLAMFFCAAVSGRLARLQPRPGRRSGAADRTADPAVSESFEPIRSYQRIFRPERRIYQIEGRTLPVPGGVPLRWLAYAIGTLLAVIALGSGSATIEFGVAALAGIAGFGVGGREGAALAAIGALAATGSAGAALGLIDWPLRLIVIPAAVATLGTQATPDGRRADRFALSWLAVRLAPSRRSLGRALPLAGIARSSRGTAVGRARRAHAASCAARGCAARRSSSSRRRSSCAARRAAGALARAERSLARAGARSAPGGVALGKGEALEVRP